jgi:hypothetical protein
MDACLSLLCRLIEVKILPNEQVEIGSIREAARQAQ